MAEGETVKAEWPAHTIVRFQVGDRAKIGDNFMYGISWDPDKVDRYDEHETYRPASHFTQLVEGLEAEIDRMRDEAATLGCLRSLTCQAQGKTLEGEANKLEALLDQHKKEGRS